MCVVFGRYDSTMTLERTRLAPSPTGALHLGNARTFLVTWAMARQRGWKVVLRIEDLDGPRIKAGAAQSAIELLQWLGMDWDEGPYDQLRDLTPYRDALRNLGQKGMIYPCKCSRSDVASAQSAPHVDEHEMRYPGTCRLRDAGPVAYTTEPAEICWRVRVPDRPIAFDDGIAGDQCRNLQPTTGDFVVATRAGLPAYQLAVVVDDARQGITQVIRGDDLIPSTPRQILLYELLGLSPIPRYHHLPLVVGPDGRRLAKRHGDTRLDHYRKIGVSPQRIIGLLAHWCGFGERREVAANRFVDAFDLAKISKAPVLFTQEDEEWLTHA